MTVFPLAAELPVPELPMSDLLRAIARLRLTRLGYMRIAKKLRITRNQARYYAIHQRGRPAKYCSRRCRNAVDCTVRKTRT